MPDIGVIYPGGGTYYMGYKEIIYTIENKNIALITLNRPDAMNALTFKTHEELGQAIEEANNDNNIRVIVITGAGNGFCSGDDVKVIFGGEETPGEEVEWRNREAMLKYLQGKGLLGGGGAQLLTVNKPSIAAVNGAAVGYGCDITLMCDMRIASDKARFGEVFLRVGLIP
ncbi:MAG: enoyl-CoA hydratase/isomerase family protein, partial [Promethearchaeota archaeon]